jgi:hypothetical protein
MRSADADIIAKQPEHAACDNLSVTHVNQVRSFGIDAPPLWSHNSRLADWGSIGRMLSGSLQAERASLSAQEQPDCMTTLLVSLMCNVSE